MGITRFLDSVITIKDNYASGNEVAECNQIEIGGNTTIIHNSTGNSSFWFRNSSPSFTILSGASVYFTSTARELFYGVTDLVFTISKNASFYVSVYNVLAYGTFGTGTTIIDENATFSLNKTHYSGSYPTWYSYGTITLNKGSTLNIINNYENITSSNYNILFSGNGSGLILNNPEKVVLYNSVGNVISARNNSILISHIIELIYLTQLYPSLTIYQKIPFQHIHGIKVVNYLKFQVLLQVQRQRLLAIIIQKKK